MKIIAYSLSKFFYNFILLIKNYTNIEIEFIIDDDIQKKHIKLPYKIFTYDEIESNINYPIVILSETNYDKIVEKLKRRKIYNYIHIGDFLNKIFLNIVKNKFKFFEGVPIIGVYFQYCEYRRHLGRIPFKIKKLGYNVVIFSERKCNDVYEKNFPVILHIHQEMLKFIKFCDIFITPDNTPYLPKCAQRVLFPHGMFMFESFILTNFLKQNNFDFQKFEENLSWFDFLFIRGKSTKRFLNKIFRSYKNRFTKKFKVTLIPGGYPSIDLNINSTSEKSPDSILYAPAVKFNHETSEFMPYNTFPFLSELIIEILLKTRKEKIIFRPHPRALKDPFTKYYIEKILRKFSKKENFILDKSGNSQIETFKRSKLIITDYSSTGYNFCFTMLRPVIFLERKKVDYKISINKKIIYDKYFQMREKVGFVLTENINEKTLNNIIEVALNNFDVEKIKTIRKNFFFNLGSSEDYFIKNLKNILKTKKREWWILENE